VICLDSGERELCKGTILYSGTGPFRFSNVLSECWNGWIGQNRKFHFRQKPNCIPESQAVIDGYVCLLRMSQRNFEHAYVWHVLNFILMGWITCMNMSYIFFIKCKWKNIKVKILQFDTLVATFACLFLGNGTRKRKSVDGQQKVISSINSKKKETASKLHET
jgi:hypothetical protein